MLKRANDALDFPSRFLGFGFRIAMIAVHALGSTLSDDLF
jgi:hypothetical protein